jgi:restriction-modification system family protein
VPGLRKTDLCLRVKQALESGDIQVSEASFVGAGDDLPWRCEVRIRGYIRRTFLIYIWTIGHGGRSRPADEYRIQAKLKTGRDLRFRDGVTVVLGYYRADLDSIGRGMGNNSPSDMEVFVAWDSSHHSIVGASSSCQVRFALLYEAYLKGAAVTERRTRGGSVECVFALRPERVPLYFEEVLGGHSSVSIDRLQG